MMSDFGPNGHALELRLQYSWSVNNINILLFEMHIMENFVNLWFKCLSKSDKKNHGVSITMEL